MSCKFSVFLRFASTRLLTPILLYFLYLVSRGDIEGAYFFEREPVESTVRTLLLIYEVGE